MHTVCVGGGGGSKKALLICFNNKFNQFHMNHPVLLISSQQSPLVGPLPAINNQLHILTLFLIVPPNNKLHWPVSHGVANIPFNSKISTLNFCPSVQSPRSGAISDSTQHWALSIRKRSSKVHEKETDKPSRSLHFTQQQLRFAVVVDDEFANRIL